MKNIIKEWEKCNKIKVFEFEVTNKRTREKDWVTFDVVLDVEKGQLKAQHEALNQVEADSEYIACKVCNIDPDFSLDENLQELYSICEDAISQSEFFKIWELSDKFDIYTLPAFFAPALINADCSGLTDAEEKLLNDFINKNTTDICSGCSDDTFFTKYHDLPGVGACDCKEFYFRKKSV